MVRALAWKDQQSFLQHVEMMTNFRKSHRNNTESGLPELRDMPAQGYTIVQDEPGRTPGNIGQGITFLSIPIGGIALACNSQN